MLLCCAKRIPASIFGFCGIVCEIDIFCTILLAETLHLRDSVLYCHESKYARNPNGTNTVFQYSMERCNGI